MAAIAWSFFAVDSAAVLFFLFWMLTASSREGESAYAMVFFVIATAFLGVGGGGLALGTRRKSSLGIGCAGLVLAIPPLVALAIWISNLV